MRHGQEPWGWVAGGSRSESNLAQSRGYLQLTVLSSWGRRIRGGGGGGGVWKAA